MIKLGVLRHGGIMPNYQCTAACRHCLYACSMDRAGGYMSQADMDAVCATLREGGCRSVHIGGGEPFMDFDGLLALLKTARSHGISVEYIETNGYWAASEDGVKKRLQALACAGADTLCISVDPYHAEYVPYTAPLNLAKWCRAYGFGYFLWQERFVPMMQGLDPNKAHTRAEMEAAISPDYIRDTALAYGIRMGGRAVNIADEYYPRKPVEDVVKAGGCRGLQSTDHFHVDMYGRFIPPGCTGIAIPLREAVDGVPSGKYPAFEALLKGGVAALLEYAVGLGFVPDARGYTSGCGLCFYLRRWLSERGGCAELDGEHYLHSFGYYG